MFSLDRFSRLLASSSKSSSSSTSRTSPPQPSLDVSSTSMDSANGLRASRLLDSSKISEVLSLAAVLLPVLSATLFGAVGAKGLTRSQSASSDISSRLSWPSLAASTNGCGSTSSSSSTTSSSKLAGGALNRSEEHTSELQSQSNLVC